MDKIYTGRTSYFEVQITPTPTNLEASQVSYNLYYGDELIFTVEASSLISSDTVGITIDSDLTENLDEGIYIFEATYTHDGATDTIVSGKINILRR